MIQPINMTVRFNTPAFLGDFEQQAQWRSPPFKAQLRQWWRVVQARRGIGVNEMRTLEGHLFGSAASDDESTQSAVRIRLGKWQKGAGDTTVSRPVISGKNSTKADLYLGYGPITLKERRTAIAAGDSTRLRIALVPHPGSTLAAGRQADDIGKALALMDRFGTLGSRSRNAWGSYTLDGAPQLDLDEYLLDWREALGEAWVRGVGRDEHGALIWHTTEFKTWQDAMHALGQIRVDSNHAGGVRTLQSYPVTGKSQPGWKGQDRLPGNVRLKVLRTSAHQFVGQVTHLPCRPNDALMSSGRVSNDQLISTWQKVHAQLDSNAQLTRPKA